MLNPRKPFRFQVSPSDHQLWAIGMVAVQWSSFEALFVLTAEFLLAVEPEQLARFKQDRRMERRLDIVRDGIERDVVEPYRGRLLTVLKSARQLKVERDRYMHNQWGGSSDDPVNSPMADTNFNMSTGMPFFSWKLDFGRIRKTALDIELLTYNWTSAIIDGHHGQADILLSAALKSKMLR